MILWDGKKRGPGVLFDYCFQAQEWSFLMFRKLYKGDRRPVCMNKEPMAELMTQEGSSKRLLVVVLGAI